MKIGSIIKAVMLFSFIILINYDVDAQTKKRRPKEEPTESRTRVRGEADSEKPSFTENLNYEIKFGNIGFSNQFSIALKPSVGYKFHKYGSAGVGSRLNYTFINRTAAPDLSFIDYGFFGYARARLGNSFYLQGEYTTYSLDFDTYRKNNSYPLFGAGYLSGYGDWTWGAELLFIGNGEARDDYGSVVEWWFSASYNF